MGMYEHFQTDVASERDGIWLEYPSFRVRLAYAGGANKKFQKEVERLARPHRRAIATDNLPPEITEKLMRTAYARAVVRAWEVKDENGEYKPGIEAPDGSVLEFNFENVMKTFEALPTLFSDFQEQAANWALYKASLRDEAAGN